MKRLLIPVLALIALSASCARQEYDISEGVNKEVTLFENVISAPIGGKVPYTNWQLQSANKVVTVGLTYDL
ncbi:MAG: hypothetical protein K6E37_03675 [Bacteroidales bacterium]|nr:hypothetical protein [Bacteroidales bacterium]